ncbi:hypothetical protein RU639_012106 [Aspergillus parasiticus]
MSFPPLINRIFRFDSGLDTASTRGRTLCRSGGCSSDHHRFPFPHRLDFILSHTCSSEDFTTGSHIGTCCPFCRK